MIDHALDVLREIARDHAKGSRHCLALKLALRVLLDPLTITDTISTCSGDLPTIPIKTAGGAICALRLVRWLEVWAGTARSSRLVAELAG